VRWGAIAFLDAFRERVFLTPDAAERVTLISDV
jgi:hypothetical protein